MAEQGRHEAQAKHNKDMLVFIDAYDTADQFRDWYITVTYYTALHYFEAILPVVVPQINRRRKILPFKEHYHDHGERLKAMADAEFATIHKPYATLHKISKAAKYNEHDVTRYIKELVRGYLTQTEIECKKVRDAVLRMP